MSGYYLAKLDKERERVASNVTVWVGFKFFFKKKVFLWGLSNWVEEGSVVCVGSAIIARHVLPRPCGSQITAVTMRSCLPVPSLNLILSQALDSN